MKQSSLYKLIITSMLGMLFSTNAAADYSKSFEGYKVFNKYCFICHGAEGKGDGPLAKKIETKPADLTDNNRLSKRTDKELIRIIEGSAPHGTVSSDMPSWNAALSYTQIRSLAAYIRYLHRGQNGISGNPVAGKEVYDNSCVQCHGYDGEGDGVLTRVYSMNPANHTNAERMDKMSNEQIRDIIAKGGAGKSLMPGWEGILSKQEIEDVISYIRLMAAH